MVRATASSAANTLPMGLSDFERLRESGMAYADKPGGAPLSNVLPCEAARLWEDAPRLDLSVVVLQRDAVLSAEALWQERARHRVLRLGFSRLVDFADRSDLENKFKHYLREALAAAGLESPDPTMGSFVLMWRRALRLPEPIVLIVDDCDAPITAHLFEPEKLLASQAVLNDFFLGSKRAPGICASRF